LVREWVKFWLFFIDNGLLLGRRKEFGEAELHLGSKHFKPTRWLLRILCLYKGSFLLFLRCLFLADISEERRNSLFDLYEFLLNGAFTHILSVSLIWVLLFFFIKCILSFLICH